MERVLLSLDLVRSARRQYSALPSSLVLLRCAWLDSLFANAFANASWLQLGMVGACTMPDFDVRATQVQSMASTGRATPIMDMEEQ